MSGYATSLNALSPVQRALLILLFLAVILANIRQDYPDLAPLQHIPTVVLIALAPPLIRYWRLDTPSIASIWLFMLLHTLAGRYIYSYVPYDDWLRTISGHSLSEDLGWKRNNFDRLVHFAFGALWTLPVSHAWVRRHGISLGAGLFIGFFFVGAVSAIYEIFEWLLTVVAAGDTADYYNGQQGDMWDPQKDMACAIVGSAVAMLVGVSQRVRNNRS